MYRRRMRMGLCLTLSLALIGCGDDAPTGQGGAGQGTTSSTLSSTATSLGEGGSGAVCTDAAPAMEVTIVLRNDSSERIWLRDGGYPDTAYFFDVEEKRVPRCPCIGMSFCKSSGSSSEWSTEVGFLDPGAEYRTTWQALLYENAQAGCTFEDDCSRCGDGTCQLGVVPLPGPLEVKGFAYADDECFDCECDASLGELCSFTFDQEAPMLDEPIEATAILQYGTDDEVVVSFTD